MRDTIKARREKVLAILRGNNAKTQAKIAKQLSVSKSTIHKDVCWLISKRLVSEFVNVEARPRADQAAIDARRVVASEMCKAGASIREIAAAAKVSENTVHNDLRACGLTVRDFKHKATNARRGLVASMLWNGGLSPHGMAEMLEVDLTTIFCDLRVVLLSVEFRAKAKDVFQAEMKRIA